jgi:putative endonuclease
MKSYYVYILASKRNGTLYIGVTSNLLKRIGEHKNKLVEGFTKKYGVDKLVYYEETVNAYDAIKREKKFESMEKKLEIGAY